MSEDKITREELIERFGSHVPIEVMNMLCDENMTAGEIRAKWYEVASLSSAGVEGQAGESGEAFKVKADDWAREIVNEFIVDDHIVEAYAGAGDRLAEAISRLAVEVYARNAKISQRQLEEPGTGEPVGQYGETKSEQAYQVIGTLATVGECFEDPEVQRALDYFSSDKFDPNFLPFKRPSSIEERSDTASPRADGQPDTISIYDAASNIANTIGLDPCYARRLLMPLIVTALINAVKAEREACAKVADEHGDLFPCGRCEAVMKPEKCSTVIADTIRSRGETSDA